MKVILGIYLEFNMLGKIKDVDSSRMLVELGSCGDDKKVGFDDKSNRKRKT